MQVTLKGVASTLVIQSLLKNWQRAKFGGVVDGP
jgi:hypothetical protein